MKKSLLLLFTSILFSNLVVAQSKSIWRKLATDNIPSSEKIRTTTYSLSQQLFQIDLIAFKNSLVAAKDKLSGQLGILVDFPTFDGSVEQFLVWENSNFEPALQVQLPNIRAYVGKSLVDGSTINFSISQDGVQTFVSRIDNASEFIEPYTKDSSVYVLFDSKSRTAGRLPLSCTTVDRAVNDDLLNNNQISNRSNNQVYKTMRLALSCVGEYGSNKGGTFIGTIAAMNATMTRVNGVLEKDLALHLNIIANNNLVMYYNGSTDPYSSGSVGSGGAWNTELQNNLSTVLGNAAYDIGHLFGQSGGGGNAGCIGCVCEDDDVANLNDENKGSGFTSPSDGISQGDTFDIDYVVHEMGHQLGANHTFSHQSEGTGVNVEPGSGSTIMGYAGITSYDVQNNSDAYFTYRSILQIQNNLAGRTCSVDTPITNTPPVVDAGANFTIPKGTAFKLSGVVSDAEGDTLSYCWEQNNSASSGQTGANSVVSATKTLGPNFRSLIPSASPDRFMPKLSSVLAGNLTSTTNWESIATVGRSSKFTLTVRDNNPTGQQTNTDEVTVTTSATAGPFTFGSITGRNIDAIFAWEPGQTKTINWNVNNTNTIPGGENVNIKFSIDGGLTFPYDLILNTPNDGTEDIIVPVTPPSLTCRLLIEAVASPFYVINPSADSIYTGYTVTTVCNTYNYTGAAFAIPDGSGNVVKTVAVPASTGVSDVNVSINATHSNLQNLIIAMTRPGSGTQFQLFNQQCATNADMNVTFDQQASALVCASPTTGTYAPSGTANLNLLNVNIPAGNFSFNFRDVVAINAGTVNSIAVEICKATTILTSLANENFEFKDFALFPNPTNGAFTVRFNSNSSNPIAVSILDISGRKIFDKTFTNSGLFEQNLQLDKTQAGIYLISITDGAKKIVKRIVVE